MKLLFAGEFSPTWLSNGLKSLFKWQLPVILLATHMPLASISKDAMMHNLETANSIFDAKYAPMHWKQNYLDWSLGDAMSSATWQINSAPHLTLKGYQRILFSFFQSFHDHHVSITFHSTEKAFLPFKVMNIGNRIFVSDILTTTMGGMLEAGSYSGTELKPGCELLSFNSMPIDDVISTLVTEELHHNLSLRRSSYANLLLTSRIGALGHRMPAEAIEIRFLDCNGDQATASVDWIYVPEEILYKGAPSNNKQNLPFLGGAKALMVAPHVHKWHRAFDSFKQAYQRQQQDEPTPAEQDLPEESTHEQPELKPRLCLGSPLWKEEVSSIFTAYIYESQVTKKKIGYVRLHTYYPSEDPLAVNNLAEEFASIIRVFEEKTDGLIIDQVDNGGGIVLYVYALASVLSDQPLALPQHRMTVTQKEVSDSLKETTILKSLLEESDETLSITLSSGYPCDRSFYEGLLSFCNFTIDEWNNGKTLTDTYPLYGLREIQPHSMGCYTKPILVLINEQCYSGADFFPAILQDNCRAKLFGATTAGAGGCVEVCSYPNLFGIEEFSYTSSFAERSNGSPLENIGVSPDLPYAITENDIKHDFIDYKNAVNHAIEQLLEGKLSK